MDKKLDFINFAIEHLFLLSHKQTTTTKTYMVTTIRIQVMMKHMITICVLWTFQTIFQWWEMNISMTDEHFSLSYMNISVVLHSNNISVITTFITTFQKTF